MATSPNYAWAEPDNSSLVKNGAQDIRALGDAIDTSVWNIGFGQAGKNKIINGDFSIWQRGTSFTIAANGYTADRFYYDLTTAIPSGTISRQAFTAGSAPVAGYESSFFLRTNITANNGCPLFLQSQRIEDVRTFASQTITLSFWAKADAATSFVINLDQVFGSGGSSTVTTSVGSPSLTASWQRFNYTVSVPSISGKTIGTNNYLNVSFNFPNTSGTLRVGTYDIWGVQLEYGSKATPFQTATGTLQGELAACQRYYFRFGGDNLYQHFALGMSTSSTAATVNVQYPVPMRIVPTSVDFSNLEITDIIGYNLAASAATITQGGKGMARLDITNGAGATTYRPAFLRAANSLSAYLGMSAEL